MKRAWWLVAAFVAACGHDTKSTAKDSGEAPASTARRQGADSLATRVATAATARAACGPPLSKGAKTGSVTTLSFMYADTVKLTDEPNGDGQVEYKYRGFEGAIGYHLVELALWGGSGTWYEAYDACTGKKLVIDGPPVVSPDSTRFVTVGFGTPREALAKRIQVLTRQGSRDFSVEWDFEVPVWAKEHAVTLEWGPVNPRWTGSGSLRFDRVDKSGRRVGGATGELRAGHWTFTIDTTAGRGE